MQIELGGKDTGMLKPYTIVGVLGDQADHNVGAEVQPFLMLPQQQVPTTSLFYQALLKTIVHFAVKTKGNVPVAAEMRSVFHEVAPSVALDEFQTMQKAVDQNTFSQRLGLYLVGSFAGLAVSPRSRGRNRHCRRGRAHDCRRIPAASDRSGSPW